MVFKIGDKVRIIKSPYSKILGSEGVLTEVRPPQRQYHYRGIFYSTSSKRFFEYPLKDDEIEKIYVRGQQLMFSFMDGVKNEEN